ncbi:protein of unknown function [endosymbiont DhMRE of Dentiscutata heterogama]|uniref:hypothetical protein n=1 Tax=endosymbiont DhMRE of Dentiscutata heterogama TaxID=1609546 RepID=UPI000629D8AF|nr:hypothetical protein [endosymbiont DhMRE of Dentiscutata heterogama]CFW92993.1 protein of unknown function [endosymbiont DhMRE of Dentiscutata heterogama]
MENQVSEIVSLKEQITEKEKVNKDLEKERDNLKNSLELWTKQFPNQTPEQIQKKLSFNFWENCPQKTKPEIMDMLFSQLGKTRNELDDNCLDAIAKKVVYFYGEEKDTKKSISSMTGQVVEITQKIFGPENKRRGQIYYLIKLTNKTTLKAKKYNLPEEKWTQVEKLEILNQDLLFKYWNSIFGKDIYDFYPIGTEPISQLQPNSGGAGAPDTDGENQVN